MVEGTPVFGDPTITIETFSRVLAEAGSPVLAEQPAGVYWTACRQYNVDPAFMLAIGHHEHHYGTAADAIVRTYATKNWGNTRSLSLPLVGCRVIDTTRGPFVKYAQWVQSWADACYRLLDPHKAYHQAGASTVETIIPIWAPASDSNTPDAYIRAVLTDMAAWAKERDVASPYADRADILPPGSNRPQTKLTGFHAVVIHETDNEASGANAQMHRRWLETARPDASFHFCVDSIESLQILPIDELGWHIGDGADQPTIDESFYTVAIEICVNSRAGFPLACRRAAKVAARVLKAKGAGPASQTVRQHGSYWSPQNPAVHTGCPKHLKAGDWGMNWNQFLALVAEEYVALVPKPPDDAHERLQAFYRALPPELRGLETTDIFYEAGVDLSDFPGLPPEGHALASEYVYLWTAPGDHAIHAIQPALWERLLAEGKVTRWG